MKNVRNFWILSGIIVLFNIVAYVFIEGNTLLIISDLLPVVCAALSIMGVASVINYLKTFDITKKVWLLMLIGLVFNFIAELLYFVFEVIQQRNMDDFFPSYADPFWIIGFVFFFVSIISMIIYYLRSGMPHGKTQIHLIIIFSTIVLAILVTNFLLLPIARDPETSLAQKAVSLFYPITDISVVCLSLIVMYIVNQFSNRLFSMPWILIALGYLFFTASDLIYSYLSWQDDYSAGNFFDIGWNAGYLLIGLAGIYQFNLMKKIKEER